MKCPECLSAGKVRSASSIVAKQTKHKGKKTTTSQLALDLSDYKYVNEPANSKDCSSCVLLLVVPFGLLTLTMTIFSIAAGSDLSFLTFQWLLVVLGTSSIFLFKYFGRRSKPTTEDAEYMKLVKSVDRWNSRVSSAYYCLRCGVRFDEKGVF